MTAPRAEDRYKESIKDSVAYFGFPDIIGTSIRRVWTPKRAKIQRKIQFNFGKDNDTIYTEVPEHSNWRPVNIKPRKGFSFINDSEYNILKRRFNTAWNLAK